ncbi:ATP-binding protein [Actinacidiphila glaucinigra]|uniref:ATP-binding protein n=1 Tax=Actinacidiphila glaucinigra TaxID=235986 RepID=UPI002DDB0CBF|nr:ATP-binding protein [Actinacidiphila glaucinigra]WSD64946.1 ATP-binding protein [Actinacidiphila glaucinigra]
MTAHASLRHRHVLTLPTEPAAVAIARKTAEYVYPSWGVSPSHPVFAPALLILSELVTNSVRHAAEASPSLDVIYAASAGVLAFAVHDRHPYRPDLINLANPGGGLAVVAEILAELGGTGTVRPDADSGGKSIWVTLPLQ